MQRLSSLLTLVAVSVIFGARAEASPIPVSADATVAGGLFVDRNFGAEDIGGGLLSGMDGSGFFGPYRFYLRFTLPTFTPNTQVASATLQGFYSNDWDTFDDRTHSIYQSATNWSESTITWNNQPGAFGGPLAVFNAATSTPGTNVLWDLTSAVNTAYLAQALQFSLLFRADDETTGVGPMNNSLEYFASREFLNGQHAFSLNIQIVDAASVPEPTTLLLVGSGLAGAFVRSRRRRRL